MARVAFTLRRSAVDRGSYARYDITTYNAAASAGNSLSEFTWIEDSPPGTRDVDTSLRSSNYQLPPNEFVESYLEAYVVDYSTVQINWGAALELIGDSVTPTESILVYSSYGPAATISSGIILSEGSTNFSVTDDGSSTQWIGGQWVYYTLFIRYQSTGGDDYYEPAATVEVLIPENYGSTLLLWNRIPEYYRQQDIAIGSYVDPTSDYATKQLGSLPPGNVVGPLFKFLSIFGFDMDRTRTLLDFIMLSRDPYNSNVETLDALARTVGVGFTSNIINASRVRTILDDIGYLRRTKGTFAGVQAYAQAISNCQVTIDTDAQSLTFYAQRVNYFTDPLDADSPDCNTTHRPAHVAESQVLLYDMGTYDASTYATGTYPDAYEQEYLPGMYWTAASAGTVEGINAQVGDYVVAYLDEADEITFGVNGYTFDSTTYSAYTDAYSAAGSTYTYDSATSSGASVGVNHILFHIDCPIPVLESDTVYFSVHSGLGTSGLRWARMVDVDGNVLGSSNTLTRAGDAPAAGVSITDNASPTEWTVGFMEFLVDMDAVSTYGLRYLLAERNHIGAYFDGSVRRGGWLVSESGTVSDYRWSTEGENNGNAYQSVSVYTEEFQRTRALITNFFSRALPVTVADVYTIYAADAIPGQSAIDAYLTS